MKVSIIVPVYNTGNYLNRCLESIINQNFIDIEIIIINDCSTDNSLEIIKFYMEKDKRIILIDKEKNEGLSAARNSGIKIAKGKYILHIDSDDWIEQSYLKEMYNCAEKNKADIIISDFYEDFDNGEILYRVDQKTSLYLSNEQCINNIFLLKGYPCVWNKLIRTELYKKYNIFHPNGVSLGEDLMVIPKLFYFSKRIVKLNKAYLHYIQNKNSITRKTNINKVFNVFYVLKDLEEFFKNKKICIPKEFKIISLNFLYECKYNLNNKEYIEILKYYLILVRDVELKRLYKNKKLKIRCKILKFINNKYCFLVLWELGNFLKKIKLR